VTYLEKSQTKLDSLSQAQYNSLKKVMRKREPWRCRWTVVLCLCRPNWR